MATNFVCNDTAANGSAIAAHCSGNSNNTGDTESNQCAIDGAAGSVERTLTLDASAADLNGYWVELDNIDLYDGAAGNWTVPLTVSTTNHNVTWDEVWICHVSSAYAAKNTLGGNTAIGKSLSSSPTAETVNQAAGVTIASGDKIIVIYAFDNSKSSGQSIGITPSFTIVGPGSAAEAPLEPNVNDTLAADDTGDAVQLNVIHMPNVNDTLAVADTDTGLPTVNVILGPNVNDTVTVAELLPPPAELFVPITVTEFVQVSVVTPGAEPLTVNEGDDVTATEETVRVHVFIQPDAFDTIAVTEDTPLNVILAPDVFEDVAVTEDTPVNVILGPSVFDDVTADDTDAQTVHVFIMPNVFEDVAVTEDDTELLTRLVPDVFEDVAVTEFDNESLSAEGSLAVNEGDDVTVSEDQTLNVILMPNEFEDVAVTEDQTLNVILAPDVFDTVAVTELQTLNMILMPDEFDAVGVTEDQTLNVILGPDVFEDVLVEEDITMLLYLQPDIFDTIAVTEDVTTILGQLIVDTSDTVTVTDFRSLIVGEAEPALTIDVFDIVWLFAHIPGGADTVTVAEFTQVNVSDILDVFPATFDVITVSDFIAILVDTLVINVSDTVAVTESAGQLLPRLVPRVIENVAVVEARTLYYSMSIAQPVSVTEFVQVDVSAFEDVFPAVSDTLTVSEDVTVRLTVYVSVYDNVNLPGQFIQPNIAETITVTDVSLVAVLTTNALPIIVFDTVTLDDTVQHLPIYADGDDVAVVESVSMSIPYIAVTVSDDVAAAEDTGRNMHVPAVASDDVTVTEDTTAFPTRLVPDISDTVAVTDPASVVLVAGPTADIFISALDVVTVVDVTQRNIPLPVTVSDAVTVTELVAAPPSMRPSVFDSVTVVESPGFVGPRISAFDAVTVTDTASPNVKVQPNLFDPGTHFPPFPVTVNVTDSGKVSMALPAFGRGERNLGGPDIIVTDFVQIGFVDSSALQISVNDTVTAQDSPGYQLNPVLVNRSDLVVVVDALTGFEGGEIPWTPDEPESGFWVPAAPEADGWAAEPPKQSPWETD